MSETVVCILTGHELKDPDATVKYHTGIDMKSVQDSAKRSEPHGRLANRPIQVPDDLSAIIAAIAPDKRAGIRSPKGVDDSSKHVPLTEY